MRPSPVAPAPRPTFERIRLARVGVAAGALALTISGFVAVAPAPSGASSGVHYTIRLEDQYLATLRFLPVTFVPATPKKKTPPPTTTTTLPPTTTTTTTSPPGGTTTTTSTTTTLPPTTTTTKPPTKPKPKPVNPTALRKGTFTWRFPTLASTLKSLWRVGTNNVVLKGALMHFQSVHGLDTTGTIDGDTWNALVAAVRRHQASTTSYNNVVVSQTLPQHLQLFQNGRVTFTSPVNTGVSDAPTANGTYPVYLRYTVTTMSGFLPDGSSYSDPGIPWVSYFNGGDALHGFLRSGYGYPQSLGCVEMPFTQAAALWPHTPIGTLVTVR